MFIENNYEKMMTIVNGKKVVIHQGKAITKIRT